MFLPQLSLPLQLGFVEPGTTFEKETLFAQFGLRLFACRGWIPILCLHLFLLAEIGFPFTYFVSICFDLFSHKDWIPVLFFWMHLFASVLLPKIGFWYQNVAAALCQFTPTIISTHRRFFLMWKEDSACQQQSSGSFGCHKHKAAADEEEESDKLELVLPIVVRFCKL